MPWWGGSDKSDSGPKDFSSADETAGFGGGDNMMSSPSAGLSGGGAGGMEELQQMSMVIQQQMIVQQVMNDLTDRAYEKCITSKPSDSLSGSQVACIKSTVNKWLDSNEFMTGRLAKKSQQQSASFS
jgi:hypothetical protein